MNYRDLTRKLTGLGCEFRRHGKGSHEIWVNLNNRKKTSIPNWGRKDLKMGTIRAILRQLEIDLSVFENAK